MAANKKRKFVRLGFCLITVAMIVAGTTGGCGGGGGRGTGTGGTSTTSSALTVTTSDKSASISFPSGVFSQTPTVSLTVGQLPSGLDPLITTGCPAYDVSFSTRSVADISRSAAEPTITFVAKFPASITPGHGAVYAYRSDLAAPIVLNSTFDQPSGTVTALIPADVFDATAIPDKSSRSINPISILKIGIGFYLPYLTAQPASVSLERYVGSWESGGWPTTSSATGKRIALVVPGTFDTVNDRVELADWLSKVGLSKDSDLSRFFDYVLGINYNTYANPADTGSLLAKDLSPLLSAGASVLVFSHSLGGLVSRWAIEQAGASGTDGLVLFGTPNEGIPLIAIEAYFTVFRLSPFVPAAVAMTNYPLSGYSSFLHQLNDTKPSTPHCAYYAVDSDLTVLSPGDDLTDLAEKASHLVLVDGPDDGVVYDSSALGVNINLSLYGKSFSTNSQWPLTVSHSHIPNMESNPKVGSVDLGNWIRQQRRGTLNVGVH